jgi:hypothetical protein
MTGSVKTAVSAIALVIAFVSGWLVNGWRLNGHIETMRADHAGEMVAASETARKREQAKQDEIDTLQANLKKEQKDAKTKIARLNADVASGRVRLSVAVSGCGTGENTGTGFGKKRAELDAETAQSLVAIAADGDEAIRELNYCIDAYEAVRTGN